MTDNPSTTKRMSYQPQYVFGGIPDANGCWTGEYGLKPWPAHLQPRPTAPESNVSPEPTAFLAVTPSMRQKLADTCEALIALLDEIDGDESLEETADDEPHLGWPNGRQPNAEMSCDDDREADDCDLESGSDEERELGWQDEDSQASLHGSLYDGEPDLGFCGHATGWREGETTDDREQENEHLDNSDYEPFLGWSEDQSIHGVHPSGDEFPREDGGPAQFDGSGERIAKKQLKENARRRKAAGRKGEILFRRDEVDTTPMPRYMWNDRWTGNLPPEANEVLIPNFSMYKTSK